MTRNYPQFFAICRAFGLDKEELAHEASEGRTTSLKALSDPEWDGMLERLILMQASRSWTPIPGDAQRKKMISIARQMNWHMDGIWDVGTPHLLNRIDSWCIQQKFKKPLMKHTVQELNVLVSIFEEKVYRSYLEGLNK